MLYIKMINTEGVIQYLERNEELKIYAVTSAAGSDNVYYYNLEPLREQYVADGYSNIKISPYPFSESGLVVEEDYIQGFISFRQGEVEGVVFCTLPKSKPSDAILKYLVDEFSDLAIKQDLLDVVCFMENVPPTATKLNDILKNFIESQYEKYLSSRVPKSGNAEASTWPIKVNAAKAYLEGEKYQEDFLLGLVDVSKYKSNEEAATTIANIILAKNSESIEIITKAEQYKIKAKQLVKNSNYETLKDSGVYLITQIFKGE